MNQQNTMAATAAANLVQGIATRLYGDAGAGVTDLIALNNLVSRQSAELAPSNPLLAVARRNIRQFLAKASFATEVDRFAAGQCLDVMDAALAARQMETALASMYELLGVRNESDAGAEIARLHTAARQPVGHVHLPPDGCYKIVYDDAEVPDETFARAGALDAALRRFEQISARWNAHLFVRFANNTRDCAVPNALPAQAVDQPNDPGRTLYIDLDGVMADFDGAFPAIFGLDHRSLADDEMWGHINSHPSFFSDLPPMAGALDFFRSVEHLNPVILTACPKSNYPHVAAQKRAWVRAHLSQTCMVLPVLGGRHKPLFMHQVGDVLIDDFGKNCTAWADAGGIAIKHDGDWAETRLALASICSQAVGNG